MTTNILGILIGGIIPAFLFGIGNFLVKASNVSGISVALLLASAGFGFLAVALCVFVFVPDNMFSAQSLLTAFGFGICMALGSALVSIAIVKYSTPLGILTPLYNMNTLVAVLLALWVFAEWKQVKVPQLLLGSVLIVIGGTIVARS